MTDEQIFEVAKTCGFDEMIGEKDDETDGVYYECWEEQLLKFAEKMYNKGKYDGYNSGYDDGMWQANYNNSMDGIL